MFVFEQRRYPEGHPKGGQFMPKDASDEGDRTDEGGGTATGEAPEAKKDDKPKAESEVAAPDSPMDEKTQGEMTAVVGNVNDVVTRDKMTKAGKPQQPQRSWDDISQAHEQAMPGYHAVLDREYGLDKVMDAVYVDFSGDKAAAEAAQAEVMSDDQGPPAVIMGPPKKRERSEEKVRDKYGGDWERLTDTIRATVAVNRIQDIPAAVNNFLRRCQIEGWEVATEADDRYSKPLPSGYRDVSFNVRDPKTGLVGEIQFNTKAMMRAKSEPTIYERSGHDIYDEARKLETRGKLKANATPEEAERYEKLNQQMKDIYGAANDYLSKL